MNMQTTFETKKKDTEFWPREKGRWFHSDMKAVAYQYLYGLFDNIGKNSGGTQSMKIKHVAVILSIAMTVLSLLMSCSRAFGSALAKVTIKVIDETGQPVKGAEAGVGFLVRKQGGWASDEKDIKGLTDSNGHYSASALASDEVGITIKKEGYYQSYGGYKFKKSSIGRWQPWNPEITIVLKKKENPKPMFVRDTKMMHPVLEIPISGQSIGFDLIESDWVSPYGKGKLSDIFFRLDRNFVSRDDFDGTLTISFPNTHDGIQTVKYDRKDGSIFKLPRYAPEVGYQTKVVRTFSKKPKEPYMKSSEEDNNYFIRVRSEEKNGKLIRALYGKIHGDIRFDMRDSKTASILFKYFLNSDYTRNLEWSGENLLSLPRGEQVGMD